VKVAIIPARGGSKRVPRKNVRPFAGRPMLAWSIAAARDSGCFDRIVVSTDDAEVADVATAWGADVPFVRPAELADDRTPTLPVIAHALATLGAGGAAIEAVCCLYPTAPLVDADDLRRALTTLRETGADYVFSATTFDFAVQRALTCDAEGRVAPMFPEFIGHRSQDLPLAIHDAGMFYWGTAAAFAAERPIFGPASRAHQIPRYRTQDIDTEEDWVHAELLFKAIKDFRP
jgi:N-acylneuraminate cytidylyltransferase